MKNAVQIFDEWAKLGKDRGMQKGHAAAVDEMMNFALEERDLIGKYFSFMDLGCGNGWVARKAKENQLCEKAVGLDGAKKMIESAMTYGDEVEYILADIHDFLPSEKFDLVHSMEVIYYLRNPEKVIKSINASWLKKGGRFIVGIDHYYENESSHSWEKKVGTPMMMLKESEWLEIFSRSGLVEVQSWRANKSEDWAGTLVLTGKKE